MAVTTMTTKGQVTIPKPIRDMMHLHPGDKVEFVVQADGQVVIKPQTLTVDDIFGMFHDPKHKPLSIDEINEIVARQGDEF
jgi:antitoxin PrlF